MVAKFDEMCLTKQMVELEESQLGPVEHALTRPEHALTETTLPPTTKITQVGKSVSPIIRFRITIYYRIASLTE